VQFLGELPYEERRTGADHGSCKSDRCNYQQHSMTEGPQGPQTADKPQLFNWGLLFLGPLYQYSSDIQKQHNEK